MTPSAGCFRLSTRIRFAMHSERSMASPSSCKAWSLSMAPVLGRSFDRASSQVALAHGERAGLGNSGWCWSRWLYRRPIERDHGGAEVAQNADLERRDCDRQMPLNWWAHCRPQRSSPRRAIMPWRSKPIRARSIAMWFCSLTIPKQSPPQLKPTVEAGR
jgi:hypothetical protein